MGLYEDVASSIEPGQRCQRQETLSDAHSGPHAALDEAEGRVPCVGLWAGMVALGEFLML
ncbi:hypothetical protein GCM10010293_19390 [Streptomyces griseoflavus]|nr:hypothetical protein GCM10010293_19390 [Streptomyces griseoflavus]